MVLTGLSVQEVGSKRMANKQQIKKSERNWLVQKGKCTWKNSKTNESWLWDLGTVVKDSVPKMITGCSLFARLWVGAPQLMSGDESQKKNHILVWIKHNMMPDAFHSKIVDCAHDMSQRDWKWDGLSSWPERLWLELRCSFCRIKIETKPFWLCLITKQAARENLRHVKMSSATS